MTDTNKYQTIESLWTTARNVYSTGQEVKKWWKTSKTFTVTIESEDALYDQIAEWMLDVLPKEAQRSITAYTGVNSDYISPADDTSNYIVRTRYDGKRTQTFRLHGHRIEVSISQDTPIDGEPKLTLKKKPSMIFTCPTTQARTALLNQFQTVSNKPRQTKPVLSVAGKYGWTRRGDIPTRHESTVILKNGVWEQICSELQQFLDQQHRYHELGIPWRHGILLYGPPGTGKTTIIKQLAQKFSLNLYSAMLSDCTSDSQLRDLFNEVSPRSILAIEDIDTLAAAVERDNDSKEKVTTSGLLNALDGIASAEGIVTVMTTNRPELLDEALIRPGRCDQKIEIGYLDVEQLQRLSTVACGRPVKVDIIPERLSPADVLDVVKPHINNPDQAYREIEKLVNVLPVSSLSN